MVPLEPVMPQWKYYECEHCGTSLKGPRIRLNRQPNEKGYMETKVPFPFPAEGFYSSKEGLRITFSGRKIVLRGQHITYCITFPNGQELKIVEKQHECPKKLRLEEVAVLWQQGQRSFPSVDYRLVILAARRFPHSYA